MRAGTFDGDGTCPRRIPALGGLFFIHPAAGSVGSSFDFAPFGADPRQAAGACLVQCFPGYPPIA